mmetsp:Transcript_30835/g.52175  ORF Transcript_30835/g.52175 Transcript_30835/m.52175 type:complete len:217 (-) Transcript_30835:115-765(-)
MISRLRCRPVPSASPTCFVFSGTSTRSFSDSSSDQGPAVKFSRIGLAYRTHRLRHCCLPTLSPTWLATFIQCLSPYRLTASRRRSSISAVQWSIAASTSARAFTAAVVGWPSFSAASCAVVAGPTTGTTSPAAAAASAAVVGAAESATVEVVTSPPSPPSSNSAAAAVLVSEPVALPVPVAPAAVLVVLVAPLLLLLPTRLTPPRPRWRKALPVLV